MRIAPPRPFLAVAGLLVVALGASACGSEAADGTIPATTPTTVAAPATSTTVPTSTSTTEPVVGAVPAELAGVSWSVDGSITEGGIVPAPPGSTAGFTILADGTITLDTGCNLGTGTVTFTGEDQLQVRDLAVTERGCLDEAVSALERTMLAVLAEPLVWFVDGDHLTVYPTTVTDTGLRLVVG